MRITNRQILLLWALLAGLLTLTSFVHGCPDPKPQPVYGRVTDQRGRSVKGARIDIHLLPNPFSFPMYSGQTNTFGYYRIDGVYQCDLYEAVVSHRRITFLPNYRIVHPWEFDGMGVEVNFGGIK